MQIETYEIEEIKGELDTMAADSEAMELCRKLGLDGQVELSTPETDTRFPYPHLTKAESVVFTTLFPEKTEISKYKAGIIPLRVLQCAAFCREHPMIKSLHVWHPKIVKDDPILIASDSQYGQGNQYLIARWGNALETIEALTAKAMPIWIAQQRNMFADYKRKISQWEATLEDIATEVLQGGRDFTPRLWD